MIRRYPPRHRGQYQDFHFFAAGDPTANIEAQFTRPAIRPGLPPPCSGMTERQPAAQITQSTPAQESSQAPPAVPLPKAVAEVTSSIPSFPDAAALVVPPALEKAIEFLNTVDDSNEPMAAPKPASTTPKPPRIQGNKPAPSRNRKRTKQRAASARPQPTRAQQTLEASHHQCHCNICSHPDRAHIEADFIEWAQPCDIAREYNISRASIYRHARAVGLFARRRRNLSFALSRVIECVDSVQPTADSIVRAIHALARINDDGEWIEPPAHVIVSSGGVRREASAPPARRPIAISLDSPVLGSVRDLSGNAALPAPVDTPSRDATRDTNRVEIDATR